MTDPVELPEVREAFDEIGHVLQRRPELAQRTRDYLAGRLPAVEDMMGGRGRKADGPMEQTFIRLPSDWMDEVDDLVQRFADRALLGQRVTRSEVLRAAVRRGLDELAGELGKKRRRKK